MNSSFSYLFSCGTLIAIWLHCYYELCSLSRKFANVFGLAGGLTPIKRQNIYIEGNIFCIVIN